MSWTTAITTIRRAGARRSSILLATASGACAVLAPASAEASGILSARFGADHGNPVGPNPFSIYFNPAAISAAKGTQLVIDASLVYRTARYDRPVSELSPSAALANANGGNGPDDTEKRANSGKAKLDNLIPLPFVGITSDFGTKNITAGLATYIPMGGQAAWSSNDGAVTPSTPGAVDGQQRWFNVSGRILSLYNTAAVAVSIPKAHLSIGVNGSLVMSQVHTVRARNPDGSDDTRTTLGGLKEGRALIDASGTNIAAGIGIYWEIVPEKIALGASYTIRPGFGEMRLGGTLKTQLATANPTSQDIDFTQEYPDVFRFGMSYAITDAFHLRGDVEYVTWSNFKRQCVVDPGGQCNIDERGDALPTKPGEPGVVQVVERRWKDAGGVRISASYFLSKPTELFGSLGVDTSSVPDETLDPSFIDATKYMGTVGVRQQIGSRFFLAGSYNHVYFVDTDTTGKNIFNKLNGVSKQPSAGGKYSQQFMFLNVNGTVVF